MGGGGQSTQKKHIRAREKSLKKIYNITKGNRAL